MALSLTPFAVLALLAWVCWVLARRAWARMPTEQTPTPWSRSQRRNRAGAAVYAAHHPQVVPVRFLRHRNTSRKKTS